MAVLLEQSVDRFKSDTTFTGDPRDQLGDKSQNSRPISDYHFFAWIDRGIIPLHKSLLRSF